MPPQLRFRTCTPDWLTPSTVIFSNRSDTCNYWYHVDSVEVDSVQKVVRVSTYETDDVITYDWCDLAITIEGPLPPYRICSVKDLSVGCALFLGTDVVRVHDITFDATHAYIRHVDGSTMRIPQTTPVRVPQPLYSDA